MSEYQPNAQLSRIISVTNSRTISSGWQIGEREAGGLYIVNLTLDADGNLKSRRQLIQAKISEHVNELVVLRGVQFVQFAYFSNDALSQAMPMWQATNQLPIAIEIIVEFAEQDKRQWPKTLITLQTAQ